MIEAAKPWRTRYGGDLPVAFPLLVAALDGLQHTLPRMAAYYRRACEIANAIGAVPDLTVFPNPPHSNSFQVYFRSSAKALGNASLGIARETQTWLFHGFTQGLLPATAFGEIVVGDATMGWTPPEIAAALQDLQQRALAENAST